MSHVREETKDRKASRDNKRMTYTNSRPSRIKRTTKQNWEQRVHHNSSTPNLTFTIDCSLVDCSMHLWVVEKASNENIHPETAVFGKNYRKDSLYPSTLIMTLLSYPKQHTNNKSGPGIELNEIAVNEGISCVSISFRSITEYNRIFTVLLSLVSNCWYLQGRGTCIVFIRFPFISWMTTKWDFLFP